MQLILDPNSVESYRQFLAVKRLPAYHISGRVAWFPDEYASEIGLKATRARRVKYYPLPSLLDYQRDIASCVAVDWHKPGRDAPHETSTRTVGRFTLAAD